MKLKATTIACWIVWWWQRPAMMVVAEADVGRPMQGTGVKDTKAKPKRKALRDRR